MSPLPLGSIFLLALSEVCHHWAISLHRVLLRYFLPRNFLPQMFWAVLTSISEFVDYFYLLLFWKCIVEGSLDKERAFIALVAFVNFQEENVEDPGWHRQWSIFIGIISAVGVFDVTLKQSHASPHTSPFISPSRWGAEGIRPSFLLLHFLSPSVAGCSPTDSCLYSVQSVFPGRCLYLAF